MDFTGFISCLLLNKGLTRLKGLKGSGVVQHLAALTYIILIINKYNWTIVTWPLTPIRLHTPSATKDTVNEPVTDILLNELPQLQTSVYQKRITVAGLTASNKWVGMRWKHNEKLLDFHFPWYCLLRVLHCTVMGAEDSRNALWVLAAEKLLN